MRSQSSLQNGDLADCHKPAHLQTSDDLTGAAAEHADSRQPDCIIRHALACCASSSLPNRRKLTRLPGMA